MTRSQGHVLRPPICGSAAVKIKSVNVWVYDDEGTRACVLRSRALVMTANFALLIMRCSDYDLTSI